MVTKIELKKYFTAPQNPKQRQYEALRAFFVEKLSAQEAAEKFGYGIHRFYSITKSFRKELEFKSKKNPFFTINKKGRKHKEAEGELRNLIIGCRKQYLSVPDIKAMLDAKGYKCSQRYIHLVLTKEGFSRLPRRSQSSREDVKKEVVKKIEAPKSKALSYDPELFSTQNTIGILCLIPIIEKYGIRSAILKAGYPRTSIINNLSSILQNNWSAKRHEALASMPAVLAQDPDSGIITYGDTNVRHENEAKVVLEFLDFYQENTIESPKYIVFDSKFTTYENLNRLDDKGIKFVTIRRRGKNIVEKLEARSSSDWKKIRVIKADGKGRILKVIDEKLKKLKDYPKPIRQVAITGHGRIKPCLIITNDFEIKLEDLVRKYTRRWIVEKEISEQIEFFHLNRVSSSIVIKVDFDFTMSILAHNLYRLFAVQFSAYSHFTDQNIFEKFFSNSGFVEITDNNIIVSLKKKRHLPHLLTEMKKFESLQIPWLNNKKMVFVGAATT